MAVARLGAVGICDGGRVVPAKNRKRRESFGAIRKLPSGRYQASYVGPDGERYTAPSTFTAIEDARAWLARRRIEIADDQWTQHTAQASAGAGKGRATTFAEYAEQWVATRTNRHGDHLRPRTAAEYRRLIAGPLKDFGPLRLTAIGPEAVRAWYSGLIAAGTKTQAARAYELLKAVLATAVDDGRLKVNPCQIRGGASATTGKKVEPPTAAELQAIMDKIPERFRAAVILAAIVPYSKHGKVALDGAHDDHRSVGAPCYAGRRRMDAGSACHGARVRIKTKKPLKRFSSRAEAKRAQKESDRSARKEKKKRVWRAAPASQCRPCQRNRGSASSPVLAQGPPAKYNTERKNQNDK